MDVELHPGQREGRLGPLGSSKLGLGVQGHAGRITSDSVQCGVGRNQFNAMFPALQYPIIEFYLLNHSESTMLLSLK